MPFEIPPNFSFQSLADMAPDIFCFSCLLRMHGFEPPLLYPYERVDPNFFRTPTFL